MKRFLKAFFWILFVAGLGYGLHVEDNSVLNRAYGAEGTKVSDMTALSTAPAMDDLFYIVDSSESGSAKSKSITIEYLRLSGVSNYTSGTTATLDFSVIDSPMVTLSGTTTVLVMGGLPTSGTGMRAYYLIVVNASGSGAITWPSDVVWPSGTEVQPTSGTSNTVDVFPFLYGIEGGTTKYMLTPVKDLK